MGILSSRFLVGGAATLLLTGLSACAVQPYPQSGAYPAEVRQQVYAENGTVANIEPMQSTTATPPSGLGTVIGGVAGGVVGNQVGGGSGRALVTLAGVVAGAIVGNNLEAQNGSQVRQTWRISIRIDNGPYRAFDVASPGDLRVGDRVRVEGGQISRL